MLTSLKSTQLCIFPTIKQTVTLAQKIHDKDTYTHVHNNCIYTVPPFTKWFRILTTPGRRPLERNK